MNRIDLQELADIRIKEAKVLLQTGNFDGAYYLSGYAIECALKACVAKNTQQFDFPNKQLANAVYTHDLGKLVKAAGLEPIRIALGNGNPAFLINWTLVKQWNEGARYKTWSPMEAEDMCKAVSDPNPHEGVLEWINQYW